MIWLHIPKCAGTSVKEVLGQKGWRSMEKEGLHPHSTRREIIASKRAFGSYRWLAVVRNPWDLEVSRYCFHRWRVDNPNPNRAFGLLPELKRVLRQSFSHYLHWQKEHFGKVPLGKGRNLCQSAYLESEEDLQFKRVRVLRFESLKQDFARLCKEEQWGEWSVPHLRRSQRNPYPAYYTRDLWRIVAQLYERDIDAFGYRFRETGASG